MIKRALQDITNVRNKNIKLTIRKEERTLRREILPNYLEYASSFYAHLNTPIECKETLHQKYQGEVTLAMRVTLLEWLYDVKNDYSLKTTTYQLAVRILDTYVSRAVVPKRTYQLVGAVSLYIANKISERVSKNVDAYLDICDNTYTKDEFIQTEKEVLLVTRYTVNYLLPMHMIKSDYLSTGNALCTYVSEVVLLNISYASALPSELSEKIEKEVAQAINEGTVSKELLEALKGSASLLQYQCRPVRDLIARLRVE